MFDSRDVDRPYPGLRPFEPHEGEIFFGREGHVDALLDILNRERFLAVVGPSGGGKSSLVRAGLLPALASGRLGTGSHWRLALLRPGAQPFLALAQALTDRHALGIELAVHPAQEAGATAATRVVPASAEQASSDAALIAADLRRGPDGFARVLAQAQAARVAARGPGEPVLPTLNLLVLVDQFEEVFTYRDAAVDADETARFVATLLGFGRTGDPGAEPASGIRVVVALTMRTDFLGHCVEFEGLPEAINRAQYLTPRLRPEELCAAIIGPARMFGGEVDARFAEETVAGTGTQGDQLPLLQHALAQWWRAAQGVDRESPRIDADCLRDAGTMHEALNLHADRLYAAMSPEEQLACEWMFRAITAGREGAEAVRRPRRLDDIAAWSGQPEATLARVVRQLADPEVSFVHHGATLTSASVIDLAHEALMRQWHLLSAWVASELRRAQGWARWHARAIEHEAHEAELLAGAELARALDWWNPDAEGDGPRWSPTPGWCDRYLAGTGEPGQPERELQRVRDFLQASRTAARSVADAERARLQDEAKRVEREQGQRRFKNAVSAGVIVAGGLLGAALWQADHAKKLSQFAAAESKKASEAKTLADGSAETASQKLRQVSLLADYWAGFGDPKRLDEALAADTAIRRIESASTPADVARRKAITLEIFAKDIDQASVRAALSRLGFVVAIRTPKLPADQTNAVWAGTPVSADDTRLVALGLVRAGIAIVSIGPIQPWVGGRDRNVIQAGATEDSPGCRPFTVAEILAATVFTRETRHHCPAGVDPPAAKT